MIMDKCNICPRECNTDRAKNAGFCKAGNDVYIAHTMLHHWEEPSISGKNGSGAIFFSGCTLRCVYCQNKKISHDQVGTAMTPKDLGNTFLNMQDKGANNINLITPTHFVPQIIQALDLVKNKLKIPVVYNTSGYEKVETIKMLSGYIDIYLPDFKYFDNDIAKKYSNAPDYCLYASRAIKEMYRQVGEYTEDENGILKKGLIIRHLVLPNCRHDSVKILEIIKNTVPIGNIRLSLMSQYTPFFADQRFKELQRKITTFEYDYVLNKAIEMGYRGFFQKRESASKEYTPDFL